MIKTLGLGSIFDRALGRNPWISPGLVRLTPLARAADYIVLPATQFAFRGVNGPFPSAEMYGDSLYIDNISKVSTRPSTVGRSYPFSGLVVGRPTTTTAILIGGAESTTINQYWNLLIYNSRPRMSVVNTGTFRWSEGPTITIGAPVAFAGCARSSGEIQIACNGLVGATGTGSSGTPGALSGLDRNAIGWVPRSAIGDTGWGYFQLTAFWPIYLSDQELMEITRDPWGALFEPSLFADAAFYGAGTPEIPASRPRSAFIVT